MSPKTVLFIAATAAVAGCTLRNSDLRRDSAGNSSIMERLGASGQVIEPKRCGLKVIVLSRPVRDKVVDQAVWEAADEQVLAPEVRHDLQANGLRVGVVTGGLPASVESAVHAPPPEKVEPAEFNLPDGTNSLISLVESMPTASLLHNRDGRAFGHDYKDVAGFYRVSATQEGSTGVALRFVPELHHGPIQRRYDSLPNTAGPMNQMQFMLKDGQQEETLRELAASLVLQPGQIAVIGCDPRRPGSLGYFLLTQAEPNSDRLLQKLVLVWATRNEAGEPGSKPSPSGRLFPVDPPDLDKKEKTTDSKGK